jgi:hypothetical protein
MKLVDFFQVSLVALTNRLLAGGDPAEIGWFEAHAGGIAVASAPSGRPVLRFYAPGKEPRLYPQWLADLRARQARRLSLLSLSDFSRKPGRPADGPPISERQLAGFNNSHETVLGLELPDEVLGIRLGIAYPPPTDLTHKDVLAFIAQSPEREHFRKAMLWEDENNLHFTDGRDWEAFLARVTPEREEGFVSAFGRSISNVAVSAATAKRWRKLEDARATKIPPELKAVEFASAAAPAAAGDPAAARDALDRALADCAAYARGKSLQPWAGIFAGALAALREGPKPPLETTDEVFARFYPSDRAHLLCAAARADVFGAMGSWNDLGLESDPEYERVSNALFRAIDPALRAACAG